MVLKLKKDQKPTFKPTNMVRACGKVRKSVPGAVLPVVKVLTSGSKPLYLVNVRRFWPLT